MHTADSRPRISACTRSDMRALYMRWSVITIDWFDVWFHTRDILVRDLDQGTVPAAVISRQVVYSCMHTTRDRERERERERERALLRLYTRLESASPHDTLYLHILARLEARWDAMKIRGIIRRKPRRRQSHSETNCKRILISSNVNIRKLQKCKWRKRSNKKNSSFIVISGWRGVSAADEFLNRMLAACEYKVPRAKVLEILKDCCKSFNKRVPAWKGWNEDDRETSRST